MSGRDKRTTNTARAALVRWDLRKEILALILTILGTLFFVAPALAQDGEAKVRMVHLAPDAPAVRVEVDGKMVEALSHVAYKDATPYLPLSAGSHDIAVYAADDDGDSAKPVLEVTFDPEANKSYTVAGVGLLSDDTFSARLFRDDTEAPADGKAKVRVVHAIPDVGPATVSVADGPKLFALPGFANASDYAEVDAGTYTLDVTPAGADKPAFSVPDVDVEEGEVYTAFAIGQASEETVGALITADSRDGAIVYKEGGGEGRLPSSGGPLPGDSPRNTAADEPAQKEPSQNETTREAVPQNEASQEVVPQEVVPQEVVPQEAVSQNEASREAAPQQAAPQQAVPQEVARQSVEGSETVSAAPADAVQAPTAPSEAGGEVYPDPALLAPARIAPVQDPTGYIGGTTSQPLAPVEAPPVAETPAYVPPVAETPAYVPPVAETPVYAPPVEAAPVAEAPVYTPPAYVPEVDPAAGDVAQGVARSATQGVTQATSGSVSSGGAVSAAGTAVSTSGGVASTGGSVGQTTTVATGSVPPTQPAGGVPAAPIDAPPVKVVPNNQVAVLNSGTRRRFVTIRGHSSRV